MKKFLLILLVAFTVNSLILGQGCKRITSLYGFESYDQTTHLIYGTELGARPDISQYFDYYHYNTTNKSDTLKFSGYYFLPPSYPFYVGKLVAGFCFLDNDPDKFIYIINDIDMDTHGKVIRYDNPSYYSSFNPLKSIWLDKKNDNNIYLTDLYGILPSSTGGSDWGNYSIYYQPVFLAANPYNSAIVFGEWGTHNLYRSLDSGRTNTISSLDLDWSIYSKLYFDKDESHIYAISDNSFRVSNNMGSPSTWQVIRDFNTPSVFLSVDDSISGTVYIAAGRELYYSTDYGTTLNLIKTFDRAATGIYKKPNQPIIYVSFRHKILSVDNAGNILPDVSITTPTTYYNSLYPLKVGNSWTYKNEHIDFSIINNESYTDYSKITVVAEEYINSVKYFKLSNNSFERVDPETGLVYNRFHNEVFDEEQILFDLFWSNGDDSDVVAWKGTIHNIEETDTTIFGQYKYKKTYNYWSMYYVSESLVEDFGVVNKEFSYDFGHTTVSLMGCVIDGVVYGDTTLVSVEDEINNRYNYSLSQNYPNPFNPVTNINFSIQKTENVTLKVYDVLGKEVATLVNGELSAGNHAVQFDGANLSSGLYVYQLKTNNYFSAKKMLLIK